MAYPLPSIGAKGTYTLSAPFNTIILPDDEYTCMAIRNISDYLANNDNVEQTVYLNNTLTAADYISDLKANMPIVSLQSQVGHWLYVPARFIVTFPITNGVPYHNVMLGVNIGAQPVNLDLTFLMTAISNVVKDNLGVTPEIKSVEISKIVSISTTQDSQVQTARKALMNTTMTDTARYKNLQVMYAEAIAQVQALEQYIVNNASKLGIT